MKTPLSILILSCFFINSVIGPLPIAQADEFRLPALGAMVHLSPEFNPPILKGIKVYRNDPFRFDFILDTGDATESDQQLKTDSNRLIKYFFASLAVPEKDLWVNLSPYEKNRIVPEEFGETEMGRDLLAQDYILKQITASVIYPESKIGKEFWDKVYAEASKRYGKTDIPVNTFNKVWIIPEKATVYEHKDSAFVVESKLKVMLEEDYLALEKNTIKEQTTLTTHQLGSEIVREVVIPILEKEVNEGKNFTQLRQVYNSLILATWYKRKVKGSILGKAYADQKKTAGIDITNKNEKEKIWQQYVKAFKKGAYNFIKEEYDQTTQTIIPRKYFSGGTDLAMANVFKENTEAAMLPQDSGKFRTIQMRADVAAKNSPSAVDAVVKMTEEGGNANPKLRDIKEINVVAYERGGLGDIASGVKTAHLLKEKVPHSKINLIIYGNYSGLKYLVSNFNPENNIQEVDGIVFIDGDAHRIGGADVTVYVGFIPQNVTLQRNRIPQERGKITIFLGEYDQGTVFEMGNRDYVDEDGNLLFFRKVGFSGDSIGVFEGSWKQELKTGESIVARKNKVIQTLEGMLAGSLGALNREKLRGFSSASWNLVYSHDIDYIDAYLRILQRATVSDRKFQQPPVIVFTIGANLDSERHSFNSYDFISGEYREASSNITIINLPQNDLFQELLNLSDCPLVTGDNSLLELLTQGKPFFYQIEPHKARMRDTVKQKLLSYLPSYRRMFYEQTLFKNLPYFVGEEKYLDKFARFLFDPIVKQDFRKLALRLRQDYEGKLWGALQALLVQHAEVFNKGKDLAASNTGGIDLTSAKLNLKMRNNGGEIKFNLDPAMLQRVQNAPGFVPVIINIQPMTNLRQFLGLNVQESAPAAS